MEGLERYKHELQMLRDSTESYDGMAIDAIHALLAVDGSEMTDGECMDEIIEIVKIWEEKNAVS